MYCIWKNCNCLSSPLRDTLRSISRGRAIRDKAIPIPRSRAFCVRREYRRLLRFRIIAISLLEFHSDYERPRPVIRRTILPRAHSRVANESILCGCVVYRIIFRTIFFTWPPDCIKKIAYLLCGSVLAWRLGHARFLRLDEARIRERMVRNQCVRVVQCGARISCLFNIWSPEGHYKWSRWKWFFIM